MRILLFGKDHLFIFWCFLCYRINFIRSIVQKRFHAIPGQVFSRSPTSFRSYRHWLNWNKTNDNQYLGYSVAVGSFFASPGVNASNNASTDLVVGAPRAQNLLGKVCFFSWGRLCLFQLIGEYHEVLYALCRSICFFIRR